MVAHSSAKVEFKVMAQGMCELLWLKIIFFNDVVLWLKKKKEEKKKQRP